MVNDKISTWIMAAQKGLKESLFNSSNLALHIIMASALFIPSLIIGQTEIKISLLFALAGFLISFSFTFISYTQATIWNISKMRKNESKLENANFSHKFEKNGREFGVKKAEYRDLLIGREKLFLLENTSNNLWKNDWSVVYKENYENQDPEEWEERVWKFA